MINISFENGIALIYDIEDWFELRMKHRIIGEFLGATRTSSLALPLVLSSEEACLLIKKGIGKLVKWDKLCSAPTENDRDKFEENTQKLFEEQRIVLKKERREELENVADKILEGKKRLGKCDVSREEVIEEEIKKLPPLEKGNIITQMWLKHPGYLRGNVCEVPTEVEEWESSLKYRVFEDLWEKGYCITAGRKFGGDYLVYLGDPVSFHAAYVVKCVENSQKQNITDIVALGRMGNSVKKKFVLASLEENGAVSYISLRWMDTINC